MNPNQMGPVLLSGLMIGPVLGSGIILLPPIVHRIAGDYAVLAWLLIMGVSFLFARLFAKLSIDYPGEAGLAGAVEQAFGKPFRHLASHFLMLAVCVGPVAVLSTAGEFFSVWIHGTPLHKEGYGLLFMGLGFLILLGRITWVSRVSLILSTLAALVLFTGSLFGIPFFRKGPWIATPFEWNRFGYAVLLLFWAIVGWEIIGNYSTEVRNREKTIPRAVLASVVTVSLVCLAVAGAVQWIDPVRAGAPDQPLRLATVLYPMWGELSLPVITWITAGLCLSTYLLVMGGTARLMAAQADEGALPKFLGIRTRQGVPIGGIGVLTAIHVTVFFLSHAGWVRIDQLVAIANAFFLSNALLGILAAFRLFRGFGTRLTALLLTAAFLILLSFTPLWVLAVIGGMIGYRFREKNVLNKKAVCPDADR